ncbi:hypothetical protein [Pandoraea sp. NPDC090278]|uniref:hypothetical protein n=1 Tax=Pandoraea sp. NPDC090278 TaxID=3364391 RepID=UPI003839D33B
MTEQVGASSGVPEGEGDEEDEEDAEDAEEVERDELVAEAFVDDVVLGNVRGVGVPKREICMRSRVEIWF